MVCTQLTEEDNLIYKELHDKGTEIRGENTGNTSRSLRPEDTKQQVTSLHFVL